MKAFKLLLLTVTLALLAGCDGLPAGSEVGSPGKVRTWHDSRRGVTCYMAYSYYGTGISCIPDWMLEQHASQNFGIVK